MDHSLLFNLRKFLVPEIVYGIGSLELAGRHARNLGASRVLLVSDPGIRASGWLERVETSLREADLACTTFTDISPNPRDHEVMAGAGHYHSEHCDLIVSVGGGSPMDCAKGIGVVATNGGHITDFEGVDEVATPVPPLVFIPTTAGTSADISQFAIISDTRRKVKIAIVSKMVIPDISLVDPQTTTTMSPELTAATGMDAFSHACEAYVSTIASPLTDMAACRAVELIAASLEGACQRPHDEERRGNMMMASLMAGLAFSNASLGLVHAVAHSFGGLMDLTHGDCNALLLEHVVRYNTPAAAERYAKLAKEAGAILSLSDDPRADAQAFADYLRGLTRRLGIACRLHELGVTPAELPRIAQYAAVDACLATNPREAGPKEIQTLLEEIL